MFEPVTDRSIQLADGRTLAFTEWGDLDGPAVMFFHGTPHSRLWCPDIAATQAAGVHLVIPDRPGYGRSDEPPANLTMCGWTDDVIQLADALGLDRFGVIGWSSGATYALACAAVIPDRVTRRRDRRLGLADRRRAGRARAPHRGRPTDPRPGAI